MKGLSDQSMKRIAAVIGGKRAQQGMDTFVQSYLEAALWSSTDESDESGGEPMDENYGVSDIAQESVDQAIKDCDAFRAEAETLLDQAAEEYGQDDERQGHDFWLTRNGHGAGFWDGDYGDIGDALTEIAEKFGETRPYVGDDGKIYFG